MPWSIKIRKKTFITVYKLFWWQLIWQWLIVLFSLMVAKLQALYLWCCVLLVNLLFVSMYTVVAAFFGMEIWARAYGISAWWSYFWLLQIQIRTIVNADIPCISGLSLSFHSCRPMIQLLTLLSTAVVLCGVLQFLPSFRNLTLVIQMSVAALSLEFVMLN